MKLQVNKPKRLVTKVRVLNSWLKMQGMSILLERENTCIPWWIWHWSGWDLCYITLMFMYKFVALCDWLFLVPCAVLGARMSYFALYLLRLYISSSFPTFSTVCADKDKINYYPVLIIASKCQPFSWHTRKHLNPLSRKTGRLPREIKWILLLRRTNLL